MPYAACVRRLRSTSFSGEHRFHRNPRCRRQEVGPCIVRLRGTSALPERELAQGDREDAGLTDRLHPWRPSAALAAAKA